MKIETPQWGKEVKKKLVDEECSVTEFAKRVGMSRSRVSGLINGSAVSPIGQRKICEYLGLYDYI